MELVGTAAVIKAEGKKGWPPECAGYMYQPKRPAVKKQMKEEYEKKKYFSSDCVDLGSSV